MTIVEAITQGIIQGVTEFLPVSGSGHLALYQYFTGQGGEQGALFSLVLHFGTLLAVVLAFGSTVAEVIGDAIKILRDILQRRINWRHLPNGQRMVCLLVVSLLPLFLTHLFKDFLQSVASDNSIIIEGVCFLITGALLYMASRVLPGRKHARECGYGEALAMGLMQAAAPLPGVSRSGTTLAVGMLLGLEKKFAITFSFIMGIPAICATLLLEGRALLGGGFTVPTPALLAGFIASVIFGMLSIQVVRWLVVSQKLHWFAYYTLLLGSLTVIVGGYEKLFNNPLQHAVMNMLLK